MIYKYLSIFVSMKDIFLIIHSFLIQKTPKLQLELEFQTLPCFQYPRSLVNQSSQRGMKNKKQKKKNVGRFVKKKMIY